VPYDTVEEWYLFQFPWALDRAQEQLGQGEGSAEFKAVCSRRKGLQYLQLQKQTHSTNNLPSNAVGLDHRVTSDQRSGVCAAVKKVIN
jgi:hypothetical protein